MAKVHVTKAPSPPRVNDKYHLVGRTPRAFSTSDVKVHAPTQPETNGTKKRGYKMVNKNNNSNDKGKKENSETEMVLLAFQCVLPRLPTYVHPLQVF